MSPVITVVLLSGLDRAGVWVHRHRRGMGWGGVRLLPSSSHTEGGGSKGVSTRLLSRCVAL